jgi:hypothetical protein
MPEDEIFVMDKNVIGANRYFGPGSISFPKGNVNGKEKKATSDEQIEDVAFEQSEAKVVTKKPNVFIRAFHHWKRHWILYTLLLIAVLAIILPVLYADIFLSHSQKSESMRVQLIKY